VVVTAARSWRPARFGIRPWSGSAPVIPNRFTIRFDQRTGRYWTLSNKAKNPPAGRNLLALAWSTDLRNWHTHATLLHHPDRATHAFQYADWQFDGDDIVAAVRTAWNGAPRAHDSNYITFHRFEDFRTVPAAAAPLEGP
jgi:hypothetical protein